MYILYVYIYTYIFNLMYMCVCMCIYVCDCVGASTSLNLTHHFARLIINILGTSQFTCLSWSFSPIQCDFSVNSFIFYLNSLPSFFLSFLPYDHI